MSKQKRKLLYLNYILYYGYLIFVQSPDPCGINFVWSGLMTNNPEIVVIIPCEIKIDEAVMRWVTWCGRWSRPKPLSKHNTMTRLSGGGESEAARIDFTKSTSPTQIERPPSTHSSRFHVHSATIAMRKWERNLLRNCTTHNSTTQCPKYGDQMDIEIILEKKMLWHLFRTYLARRRQKLPTNLINTHQLLTLVVSHFSCTQSELHVK